jgi:hypothetical protein
MWAPLAYRLLLELLPLLLLLLLLLLRRRRRRLLLRLPLHSTLDAQAVRSASSDLRASTPPANAGAATQGKKALSCARTAAPRVQQGPKEKQKSIFVFYCGRLFGLLRCCARSPSLCVPLLCL